MRSRTLVLGLGVILLIGLLLVVFGCGKDKDKSIDPADFSDPDFLAVQAEFERFIDSTVQFFSSGLGNIQGLATDTTIDPILYVPTPIDSIKDSVSASYADGWHVVYIGLNREEYMSVLQDSIRFIQAGEPQQKPGDLDQLLFKHYWRYYRIDTSVTHQSFIGHADYAFSGLDGIEATIEGAHGMQIFSKLVTPDSTVWREFAVDAELSNFRIQKTPVGWAQFCPSTGTVSATVEMIYQRDAETPVATTWTINATFNLGDVRAAVTSGNETWNYTEQCCTPPGAY